MKQFFWGGYLIAKFGAPDRAFERLFGPAGREYQQANFQSSNARGEDVEVSNLSAQFGDFELADSVWSNS